MMKFLLQCKRVLKKRGTLIIFMAIIKVADIIQLAEKVGFYYKTTGVWHKTNPMPRNMNIQFVNSTECWLYFINGHTSGTFNNEGKATVIPEIFLYGLLIIKGKDNSISFDTLQELGLIFCMTDLEMLDMLRLLTERYPDLLHYSDVAGIRQVQMIKQVEPRNILSHYYETV